MTLLSLLCFTIAKSANELIFFPLLKAGTGERLALITLLSLALFFFFFTYSIYLRFKKDKPKTKNHTFYEETGVYIHDETGELFCTSCLINNVESPLKTLKYDWLCLNKECNLWYNDPQNPKPVKKRKVISAGANSRVRRW